MSRISINVSLFSSNSIYICSILTKKYFTGVENPCARTTCPWGGACIARNGAAQCACPVCDATLAPVCASDQNTYGSECKMRMHACQEGMKDDELKVLYNGTCREYLIKISKNSNKKTNSSTICIALSSGLYNVARK